MTTEVRGYSRSEKHSIKYTWEINEITSFIDSAKKSSEKEVLIYSPEFSAGAKIKDLWSLELKIHKDIKIDSYGHTSITKSWISLHLVSKNEGQKIQAKYSLYILSNKKEKITKDLIICNQLLYDQICDISCKRYGFEEFVTIDKLLELQNEFFETDTLTVGVDLIVFDEYMAIAHPIISLEASNRKLCDDLRDFIVSKKEYDVIIKVGEKKFDAHKLVLSARSCVFEAMFSHNMKENKENEVTIPDIDPKVFEKVLDYIYTDKVDELDGSAEELLEASDKYQLEGLKGMCEDFLAKALTIENAITILIVANRHNAKQLEEFVVDYIAIELVKIKNTEEFEELKQTQPFLFLAILKKRFAIENK